MDVSRWALLTSDIRQKTLDIAMELVSRSIKEVVELLKRELENA